MTGTKFKLMLGIICLYGISSCGHRYEHHYNSKYLNINYIPQQQSLWCWAACSEMVIKHLDSGNSITQCDQAFRSLANETCCTVSPCCTTSMNSNCNHTNWPIFELYGFSCKDTYTHPEYLSWKKMLAQIDTNKPICLTYNWHGGGAHMIVMDGYKIIDGKLYDRLLDPYYGYNPLYPYRPVRFELHETNRYDSKHSLGRCFYDLSKI